MNRPHPIRSRRVRALGAVAAAAVVALGLAACSSGASADPSTTAASGSNSKLASEVTALTQPLKQYPVPTAPVSGVSKLAGGTIYYVPITQQAPQFAVTQSGLEAAAKAAGMKVQVCDGQGTPTAIAACINQATQAKAAGIVLDSIVYDMAGNAIDAAQQAGVPVVISNQVADPRHPATKTFAYVGTAGSQQQVALTKWMILDSQGKAQVLINESADGPSPAVYVAAGNKVFAAQCPDCKVTINKVTSSNFSLVPSSTSSALLKNPNIDYVVSQFEQYLQVTQQGVQNAGGSSALKGAVGAAQLTSMQQLAKGNFLYAATGQASAYQGWVDLDAILRLHAGESVPNYVIPVRLFTRDSIKSVPLTSAAEQSGVWFGPTTFTNDFKKLWGLS